jgi:hypothetical protein
LLPGGKDDDERFSCAADSPQGMGNTGVKVDAVPLFKPVNLICDPELNGSFQDKVKLLSLVIVE